MKIGFFDSGIGGVSVAKSVIRALPHYQYMYYADDVHMPYGNKSQDEIYALTTQALFSMMSSECRVVILACNSASTILPRIQREWLPKYYPDRTVLGVIRPTSEDIADKMRQSDVTVLATPVTVIARSFLNELAKIGVQKEVSQVPCPGLAESIEHSHDYLNDPNILHNITTCLAGIPPERPITIYTGCTHYAYISDLIKSLRPLAQVRNQGKIVTKRLMPYLERHPEITADLTPTDRLSLTLVSTSGSSEYRARLKNAFRYHFARI